MSFYPCSHLSNFLHTVLFLMFYTVELVQFSDSKSLMGVVFLFSIHSKSQLGQPSHQQCSVRAWAVLKFPSISQYDRYPSLLVDPFLREVFQGSLSHSALRSEGEILVPPWTCRSTPSGTVVGLTGFVVVFIRRHSPVSLSQGYIHNFGDMIINVVCRAVQWI